MSIIGQSQVPSGYQAPPFAPRQLRAAATVRPSIDIKHLPKDATFLRILDMNYVHLKTTDGGDLYVTQYGLPFLSHLMPENWYEDQWFKAHRERLAGTSTVYKVPTRPVVGALHKSIDIVVKWSRVGQDVPLDTFTLNKVVNAEFNTPFEEFSLVEQLREGVYGPPELNIPMQKPMAIYAPPEQMQLWQTGRSKEKIVSRVARHPGIEIDILRSYILLYQWLRGWNIIEALAMSQMPREDQEKKAWELTHAGIRELDLKGYMVADNKPTHFIVRMDGPDMQRRRDGQVLYGMIDYELLARTPEHDEAVTKRQRSKYLKLQKERLLEPVGYEWPLNQRPAEVLGVPYIWGRSESTGGTLWVVGRNPELFNYFLPEKWRYKQVRLSERRQTYYTQTKDRIHLVWEVSRVGELPTEEMATGDRFDELMRQGFNSPFEEVAIALELKAKGLRTTYPRAIYMTGQEVLLPSCVIDERRYDRVSDLSPDGQKVLRLDRDYILIWGYWRGLEDTEAPVDNLYWSPIDANRAAAKGLISDVTLVEILERQRERLRGAGFEDMTLNGNHVLLSYIPQGAIKRAEDGFFEVRQCNFETMRRIVTPAVSPGQ